MFKHADRFRRVPQSGRFGRRFKDIGSVPPAVSNIVRPSVVSTGVIGTGIAGALGSWSGEPSLTCQYQWYNDAEGIWSAIVGASSVDVAAISEEFDRQSIRLAVIPNGDLSKAAYSDPVAVKYAAPILDNAGSISGAVVVGGMLTYGGLSVTGDGWFPNIQWLADGSPIAGAAGGDTYGPIPASLLGKVISIGGGIFNSGGAVEFEVSAGSVTEVAPSAGSAQVWNVAEGTGVQTFDVRPHFTGSGLSFSISALAGVSISDGIISVNTGGNAIATGTAGFGAGKTITATATNTGGTDTLAITLNVAERSLSADLVGLDSSFATSWGRGNNSVLSIVDGRYRVASGGSSNAQARKSVAVTAGTVYRVEIDWYDKSAGAGSPVLRVGTTTANAQYGNIAHVVGRQILDIAPSVDGNLYLTVNEPSNVSGEYATFADCKVRPWGVATGLPNAIEAEDIAVSNAGSVLGDTVNVVATNVQADTEIQYKVTTGANVWRSFEPALTANGTRQIAGLAYETAATIEFRAANEAGVSAEPLVKSVTPRFASHIRFLSPTGSDSGAGTFAAPWQTPAKAGAALTAGQICYVRPGFRVGTSAVLNPTNSGTRGAPIVFTTLPGEEHLAVIDGDGLPSSTRGLVQLRARDWWIIKGIRFINAPLDAIYVEGKSGEQHGNHRIEGNQTDTSKNSGIYVCGLVMGQTIPENEYRTINVYIGHNDVTNTNWPDGGNECITVGGGVDGVIIEYNRVHDSRQYAIDVKLGVRNFIIRRNLCLRTIKHGIYLDCACRVLEYGQVYDNWIEQVGQNLGNAIVLARESARASTQGHGENIRGVAIWNNILVKPGRFGLLIYKHQDDQTNVGDFKADVFFNTVWQAGFVKDDGIEAKIDNLSGVTLLRLTNNLFAGPAGNTFLNNYAGAGTVTDSNNVKTNSPGFTNAAGLDFTLAPGSVARSAGSAAYRGYTPVVVNIDGTAYTPDYDKDYGGHLPSLGSWAPYSGASYRTPVNRASVPCCGALEAA